MVNEIVIIFGTISAIMVALTVILSLGKKYHEEDLKGKEHWDHSEFCVSSR